MRLEWDEAERTRVLAMRGLDFADAGEVFDGLHFDLSEDPDGESAGGGRTARIATFGFLGERLVVLVWSPIAGRRRIVAMRYAHAEEPKRFEDAFRRMDRPR